MSTRSDFDSLWPLYLGIGTGVAVFIFATVGYLLWRYRAGSERHDSLVAEHASIEVGAVVLIAAVVALLVFRTFSVEAHEDDAPGEAVHIRVTAFQWGWRFHYPGQGVTVVGSSNDPPAFAVPGGRPISFALTSTDVNHAFWIPEERFKRAALPGRTTHFDMEFNSRGREEGLCTEFCGLRHTNMRFAVWVLSPTSYRRWLAAHR